MEANTDTAAAEGGAYSASLMVSEGVKPVIRVWMDGTYRIATSTIMWADGGDSLPGQPMYDIIPTFSAPPSMADIDLSVTQGDDFSYVYTVLDSHLEPVDISGRTYQAQVREGGTLIFPMTCTVPVGTDGKVHLAVHHDFTDVPVKFYEWDLQQNHYDNTITTLVHGSFEVEKQVTVNGFFYALAAAGVGVGVNGITL